MKTREFLLLVVISLMLIFIGNSLPEKTKPVPEFKEIPIKEEVLEIPTEEGVQYGIASYYGEKWNGRTTANMEIFDCEMLTCASPNLPFNTIVKVTNLDNNKTITIRVNDRGPYKMDKKGKAIFPLIPHPKRVLDLSKASFRSIADLDKGLINIKYQIVG